MQQYEADVDRVWSKFTRKKLLLSALVNMIINTCSPYFNFRDIDAVYLFNGQYCFARFILPMAFILPFMVTVDMLKKSIALARQSGAGSMFPGKRSKYMFIFRIAGINGAATLTVMLVCMLCIRLSLPANRHFDGRMLAFLMGSLAGILGMFFTFLAIRRVRRLMISC